MFTIYFCKQNRYVFECWFVFLLLLLLLLQLFYDPLSGTTWVSQCQKKHSPTHISWSSSNLYQLPSTMIHSILPVQFMCLPIFLHNLSPSPLWSTSLSGALHFMLHTFLHPVYFFWNTCPYHRNLFCCSTRITKIRAQKCSSSIGLHYGDASLPFSSSSMNVFLSWTCI